MLNNKACCNFPCGRSGGSPAKYPPWSLIHIFPVQNSSRQHLPMFHNKPGYWPCSLRSYLQKRSCFLFYSLLSAALPHSPIRFSFSPIPLLLLFQPAPSLSLLPIFLLSLPALHRCCRNDDIRYC